MTKTKSLREIEGREEVIRDLLHVIRYALSSPEPLDEDARRGLAKLTMMITDTMSATLDDRKEHTKENS